MTNLEQERMTEMRKRIINDFYTSTYPGVGDAKQEHWVICRVCEWTWRYGQQESHEEGCPLWTTAIACPWGASLAP